MKKLAALLTSFLLLAASVPALADFDLTPYTDVPDVFTIEVDGQHDVAFIQTALTARSMSFTHKYESKKPINAYSVTFIIDGTSYTVNDVGSADRIEVTESGDTCEHLLIRYGTNNAELLADLMVKAMDYIIKKPMTPRTRKVSSRRM